MPRCGTRGTYLSMLDCRGRCGLETSPCRWDANSVVEFLRFLGSPIPAVRAIYGISISRGLTLESNRFTLEPNRYTEARGLISSVVAYCEIHTWLYGC